MGNDGTAAEPANRVLLTYTPLEGVRLGLEGVRLETAEMMLMVGLAHVQRQLLARAVNDAHQHGIVIPKL